MVSARKAIESLYSHRCDVYEKQKKIKGSVTTFEDIKKYENIKCRLSFEKTTYGKRGDIKTDIEQTIKIFLAPEIDIKDGSKIIITNEEGKIFEYKASGKPAIYITHQEVYLIYEEYA